MEMSKATVGVLAGFCIAAGAGGAYFAVPSNEPAPSATGTEAPVNPAPLAAIAHESETIPEESEVDGDTAQAISRPQPIPPIPPRAERRPPQPRPTTAHETQVASAPPPSAPELDVPPLPSVATEVQRVAAPAVEPVRPRAPEPPSTVEPPSPEFEELVLSADSVIGLQMETSIDSESARVEDPVVARVTRDCIVGDRVVIPAGVEARGEVTLVERGGRLRDRARLGVRFTLIVLPDGTRIPLETETIYREGDARGVESAAKIGGGALARAIIGGLFGGERGAAVGGSVGAGAGTAAVLTGGRDPATLPRGMPVTVRVTAPTIVILEKE